MQADTVFLNAVIHTQDPGCPRAQAIAMSGERIVATGSDAQIRALAGAQKEFLVDLNALSARMLEYADKLDHRVEVQHNVAIQQFVTNMTTMRKEVEQTLTGAINLTNQYFSGLEAGVNGLNGVLEKLGEKQVVIQQVKKKGWFSRAD